MESREVLVSVMEYLLASDDSAEIADLAIRTADVCSSTSLLEKVARRQNLTQAARERVMADKSAKVMAARLSRDGVTYEEQLEAAKDKRVSVAATVAEVMGLTEDAYEALSKHTSLKVSTPLALNPSASTQVRLKAARNIIASTKSSRRFSSVREVNDLFASLPGAADLVNEVPGADVWLAEEAAGSGFMSSQGAFTLLATALRKIDEYGSSRHGHWEARRWQDVVKSLGEYKMGADAGQMVQDSAYADPLVKSEFLRKQANAHDERAPQVVAWDKISSSADLEPYLESCVNGTSGLYSFLVSHPQLSDDQFTRLALSMHHSWGVLQTYKEHRDNPARAAALLCASHWIRDDDNLARCTRPTEVLDSMIDILSKYEVSSAVAVFVLRSRFFTPEMAKRMPTAALRASLGSPEVAAYLGTELRSRFGDEPSAWVAALELIAKVDTSFAEAMELADTVLGSSIPVTA